MRLENLDEYNSITIQCHDNPDADTLGAAYALHAYFNSRHKSVRMIYSGYNQIHKSNLCLMIETLGIPIEYIAPDSEVKFEGLLLTVDCQYGAGNVTRFEADEVACIDHHPLENQDVKLVRVHPTLGSCSTLVWMMLQEAGFPVDSDILVGTALYYGLYMDTNQFAELYHSLDLDMRESVTVNRRQITNFRSSNISLKELEIAGVAMRRFNFNEEHRFAIIKANPCDPNILGLISDFFLQVDVIDICVVYNEINDGYKLSVRSSAKEVNANELAVFLTEEIGTGGGHYVKAGGFISQKRFMNKYPHMDSETYIMNRMNEYFELYAIISARDLEVDLDKMECYRRRREEICYLQATDIVCPGTKISLRTQEGFMDRSAEETVYFTLERNGNVRALLREQFEKYYTPIEKEVPVDYCEDIEYIPSLRNLRDGVTYRLIDYAKMCVPNENYRLYARLLDEHVKVFRDEDEDEYMLGVPGDYLVVCADAHHDIIIEPGAGFGERYERYERCEKNSF